MTVVTMVLALLSGCDSAGAGDGGGGGNGGGDDDDNATEVYNVGDTGPAGGFIFYVDEDNDHGWTYLEAAPVETE